MLTLASDNISILIHHTDILSCTHILNIAGFTHQQFLNKILKCSIMLIKPHEKNNQFFTINLQVLLI